MVGLVCLQDSLKRHEWLNRYEVENGGTAVYGVNEFSDLTPQEFEGLCDSISTPLTTLLNLQRDI